MIAKPCQTCRGAGRVARERKMTVKIPAGIATGQQLRLQPEALQQQSRAHKQSQCQRDFADYQDAAQPLATAG